MKSRKFFISADIEGITDVTSWSETEKGQDGYEEAAHQMTLEVAAACRAILEAGHCVTVRDGHETARNIEHRLLPKGTRLMRGWAGDAGSMLAGLDSSYAGVLYIGYHAPAGSNGSPLAHTVDKDAIKEIRIDGKLASEFTMNNLFAQSVGVPSLFVSGDETICRMAEQEVSGIASVTVKKCKNNSTYNIHPEDACDRIYQTVKQMMEDLFDENGNCRISAGTCKEEYQVQVTLGVPSRQKKVLLYRGVKQISENEIEYHAKSAAEINLFLDQVIDLSD